MATPLRFAEFVFDEGRRELFRGSESVHLEPKAFALLALLLRRRPHAVAKEEIRDALWPGTVVSESSLPGLVGDLRAALGDDSDQPALIRTLRGYGYAFCGTALPHPGPASSGGGWVAVREGREIPLFDGTHLIGRGEGCLIRCDSGRVSRRHAQLRISPDRVVIEDLGSRNGTWLRGERIRGEAEIHAGDTVRVGPEAIRFLVAGTDAPTASSGD